MSNVLSKYTNSRNNNFNLIRFVAASLVLYSHSYPLSGVKGEPFLKYLGMSGGEIAVDVFFICSGFLIAHSFYRSKNILAFVKARILRIYPALVIAMLFSTFILGLYFTKDPWFLYFTNIDTYKYFINNSILLFGVEYTLPSVFGDNPYKNAVNGSIWTLRYEIKMYAYFAITGLFLNHYKKLFGKETIKVIFLCIALISLVLHIGNNFQPFVSTLFIRLFSLFFIGVAFYFFQDRIKMSFKIFITILTILFLSAFNKELFFIFYNLSLAYLIFYIAYIPSGKIRIFNKFGDYSYGIYIYAFPVQQSIAAIIPNISLFSMVYMSFATTFILSFLSWHLIEKNALMLKNR